MALKGDVNEDLPISGVYVIAGGGNKVYVGESADIMARETVRFAQQLDLPWGVIREVGSSRYRASEKLMRERHEATVSRLFRARGFDVVNRFRNLHVREMKEETSL